MKCIYYLINLCDFSINTSCGATIDFCFIAAASIAAASIAALRNWRRSAAIRALLYGPLPPENRPLKAFRVLLGQSWLQKEKVGLSL